MVFLETNQRSITYAANTRVVVDLDRADFYKKLQLLLVGQADTGAGTPARSAYNPFEIIQRVEVLVNGKIIKAMDGKMCYLENIYQHGVIPNRTQTPATESQSNQAFGGALDIYFDMDKDYIETMLPSDKDNVQNLQLAITWGSGTDIESGVTLTIDSLVCYVKATQEKNTGQSPNGLGVLSELIFTKTISQSGWNEMEFSTDRIYNRMYVLVKDNSAASNTLVTEYEVVLNNNDRLKTARFDASRAEDLVEHSLEAANQPTGVTVIDFDKGGSKPLDARGLSNFKVRFNCIAPTGTSNITVLTNELIPPQ